MQLRVPAAFLFCSALLSTSLHAQYKMDAAGSTAPAEISAAAVKDLQSPGMKILTPAGQVFCEVWFAKTAPTGGTSTEADVTLPTVPTGSLLGVIQFPAKGNDRRGQVIPAGTYTLRYVLMPVNGAHLGAAPQRDFVAMLPAKADGGASVKMSLDEVVAASTKVSGTAHPAVLSIAPGSGKSGFAKEGNHDWTLNTKVGDLPIAIILVGQAEG